MKLVPPRQSLRLGSVVAVALVVAAMLIGARGMAAAIGGVVFDGSPGSGAPPATLGGYTMTSFPIDNRPIETLVSDVPASTGSLTLSSAVQVLSVPAFWNTGLWAGGTYSGTVYWTGSNVASLTMTLPGGVKAFYFYASPFACGTFLMQATAQDGTTSGLTPVTTTCGFGAQPNARYFGFYATGVDQISSVTIALVDSSTIYQSFAVGDFAMALVSDTTPPMIAAQPTPAPNASGWNSTDVTVTWSVSDPESGIAFTTGCDATTIALETAGTTLTCSARNGAGLTSSTSVVIKIDKSAPVVTFSGNAGTYTVDQTVLITCSASDALSGIATSSCPGLSGPAYSLDLGTHSLTASATDLAGNSTSTSTSFTVGVTYTSLCNLSRSFESDSQIADSLCAQLRAAEAGAARNNANAINGALRAYTNIVSAQADKTLTSSQAAILTALAAALGPH